MTGQISMADAITREDHNHTDVSDKPPLPVGCKLVLICLAIYSVSFIIPCENNLSVGEWFVGAKMFLMGLFSFWIPIWSFAWYANPCFWIALRHCWQGRSDRAKSWGRVAVFLALSFLVITIPSWQEMWILTFYPYWIWVGSMVVFLIGCHWLIPETHDSDEDEFAEWKSFPTFNPINNGNAASETPHITRKASE